MESSTGRFVAWVRVEHPPPPSAEQAIDNERLRRRADFAAGVAYTAEHSGARQPLHWDDDGVMLVIREHDPAAVSSMAFRAAELIWQRARIDLDYPVRIGIHVAFVLSADEDDPVTREEMGRCLRAVSAAPTQAVAVTEDLVLSLPDQIRESSVRFEGPSGEPLFAFFTEPPSPVASPTAVLWDSLRKYVRGTEISRLRYVGFRLQRKEPPSLDIREVFVAPRIRLRHDRRRELRSPSESQQPRAEPRDPSIPVTVSLESALSEHRSLVFLGDPGSGKSTLLRWLAVTAAGGRAAWAAQFGRSERWLPVPLSVGRLAEIRRSFAPKLPSVLEVASGYLRERSVPLDETSLSDALHDVLSAGQAIVLLDGLDEVRAEERTAIRGWLESFAAQYPRCRFFATSREVGYSGLSLSGAMETRVEPFEQPQIEAFVRSFVRAYRRMESGHDDVDASTRSADDLLAALKRDPRLGSLAKNPFLLSALALMHRSEAQLPRHRVLAYELFARALCETWSEARRLVAGEVEKPRLSFEDEALPVLGHLALAMHREYPHGAAPEEFVLDKLAEALTVQKSVPLAAARRAAKEFLTRAGEDVQILLPRGPEQWGFLHLTFQEFFAAAGLHAEERFEEALFERLFDPRWLEVLRLGIGYLALVQKRSKKVNELVSRVFEHQEPEPRAWLTEALQKHVYVGALLAAEAGDSLRRDLRTTVCERAAVWFAAPPDAVASVALSEDLGRYDLGESIGVALAERPPAGYPFFPALRRLSRAAWAAKVVGLLPGPAGRHLVDWDESTDEDARALLSRAAGSRELSLNPVLRAAALRLNRRSVTAWREALLQGPDEVRRACALLAWSVDIAASLPHDDTLEILLAAARDRFDDVRAAAIWSLGRMDPMPPLARGALLNAVREPKFRTAQLHATGALATTAREDEIEVVLDSMLARGAEIRFFFWMPAGWDLSRGPCADVALQRLLLMARAGDDDARVAAVWALAWFDDERALAASRSALFDPVIDVAETAVMALQRMRIDEVRDRVPLILDRRHARLDETLFALVPGRPEWFGLLEGALLDRAAERALETSSASAYATRALGCASSSRAEQALWTVVEENPESRSVALTILAKRGREQIVNYVARLAIEEHLQTLWHLSENLWRSLPATAPASS